MSEWMNISEMADEQPEKRIHMERYEYAASVLSGKRILDCACGMGYGTNILGSNAVGVDIDPAAVALAKETYRNRIFEVGDIYTVPMEGYEAFVSFETLEHLDKPEAAIDRLPESITDIVVSAPIRPTVGWNPWHRSDFTHGTFCQLVERAFRVVHLSGQPWVDGKGDLYLMIHGKRGAWTL